MSDEESFHWEIEEYQKGLIIGFAFPLPFAFFGSAPEILQQYSSQKWPSVKGEIVPGFDTISLAVFIADMFIWICFTIASGFFIHERFFRRAGQHVP